MVYGVSVDFRSNGTAGSKITRLFKLYNRRERGYFPWRCGREATIEIQQQFDDTDLV